MAVDSAEKRRSISGIHLYAAGPGVTPNTSLDQEWRQEAGYGYSGLLAGAAEEVVQTANSRFLLLLQRRR